MKKRLLSILLVLIMVLTMLPMTVLAEENEVPLTEASGDSAPQPVLPDAPTDLTGLGLSVVVDCGHPAHDAPVSYAVKDDTWSAQVYYLGTGTEEDPFEYYCSIMVAADAYIAAYDEATDGIHTNATKNVPSFTLKYVDDGWTAVDATITFQVVCVSGVPTYTVTAYSGKNGVVTNDGQSIVVNEGADYTVYFYPKKGYEVSAVYVNGLLINADGASYTHYWDCDGCYDCDWIEWSRWYDCEEYWCDHHDCRYDHYYCDHYYAPVYWNNWQDGITLYDVDRDYTVYVHFSAIDTGCASDFYKDLDTDAWYHEATDYVIEKGLMKGVGDKIFDPYGKTTRGELVTMLYRLAGEPKVSGESEFTDVAAKQWYTDAVLWATKKGIVEGHGNGYFGVEDAVTREETVTILYRYAKAYGVNVSKVADLTDFVDAEKVSEFAETPFGWAVQKEIVKGDTAAGGKLKLNPLGATERVEMAALLMRFAKIVD